MYVCKEVHKPYVLKNCYSNKMFCWIYGRIPFRKKETPTPLFPLLLFAFLINPSQHWAEASQNTQRRHPMGERKKNKNRLLSKTCEMDKILGSGGLWTGCSLDPNLKKDKSFYMGTQTDWVARTTTTSTLTVLRPAGKHKWEFFLALMLQQLRLQMNLCLQKQKKKVFDFCSPPPKEQTPSTKNLWQTVWNPRRKKRLKGDQAKEESTSFFLEKQNNMNARIFHPGKIGGFEKRRGQIPNPNPKVRGLPYSSLTPLQKCEGK